MTLLQVLAMLFAAIIFGLIGVFFAACIIAVIGLLIKAITAPEKPKKRDPVTGKKVPDGWDILKQFNKQFNRLG